MDKKEVEKVAEAFEKVTEAARDSYRATVENAAAVNESNNRLARSILESNAKALRVQAEIQASFNRHTLQGLTDLLRKNREVFLGLSRKSVNAYDGFLDSLSSYYEEVSEELEEPEDR
jgi:ectoine hydroxylase-related dioxygenase (phytanoyl-CoA dioxygenase family)